MSKLKTTTQNLKLFTQVYEIVRRVPKGKVTTYGEIALRLRSGPIGSRINISPRTVGWALHANKDPQTPCHRVVNKDGRVAPNFAFDGWVEQKRRLEREGVEFMDQMHVDLKKHLWLVIV